MTHVCKVPAAAMGAQPSGSPADRWQCPECRWVWKLNPIVLRWFRHIPDSSP